MAIRLAPALETEQRDELGIAGERGLLPGRYAAAGALQVGKRRARGRETFFVPAALIEGGGETMLPTARDVRSHAFDARAREALLADRQGFGRAPLAQQGVGELSGDILGVGLRAARRGGLRVAPVRRDDARHVAPRGDSCFAQVSIIPSMSPFDALHLRARGETGDERVGTLISPSVGGNAA